MKKLVSVLIGALALAAIAPVLALALLHAVGGTAQADAPPATFWKVSMPDLGQHSDAWCWAGAAADSFWWFADHGYSGLMGGGGDPWQTPEPDSINAGSACWYDARDPGDGLGNPGVGYPTVLRKIAEKTFFDVNQNGIQDPGEANYCYGQGVEKWDYLVGLENYVNTYSHGNFMVHDIIDPAKCGVGTGYIVNRNAPTMNTRDPCIVPGVPVFDQAVRVPTFADYQTELSSGQDVLLWLEPMPGYSVPETAHVVAGVGYTNAGGTFILGTVTVADPWTHKTNPPLPPVLSAFHSDAALAGPPWQSRPDHNNSPNHGVYPGSTDPYNLCDVQSVGPANGFQIRCYGEDAGNAQPWRVVDMIFVSPSAGAATDTPTSTPTATPTPTITPTRTPTATPRPVGGVAEAPDVSSGASGGSSAPYAVIGGTIAGVLLLGAAGWYARRRWLT